MTQWKLIYIFIITDDDEIFKDLARTYSSNHEYMHQGSGLCHSDSFPEGITNGAEWYVVAGGMQDFNYLFRYPESVTNAWYKESGKSENCALNRNQNCILVICKVACYWAGLS